MMDLYALPVIGVRFDNPVLGALFLNHSADHDQFTVGKKLAGAADFVVRQPCLLPQR
jgi:hypothetical protein